MEDSGGMIGGCIGLIGGLGFYAYFAYSLMLIAQKTNTDNGWFAWVPLLNVVLLFNIARKPIWWLLLLLIPIVNIVIVALVWMGVAEMRNKPGWWGLLIFVPLVNLALPGMLAFMD